jgi:uncharacterized protein (UPF0332 family)
MTFRWADYLKVAQFLFDTASEKNDIEEGMLRASISRAYYAALCPARDRAMVKKGLDNVPQGADTHAWIINHFDPTSGGESEEICAALERLRDRRRQADYVGDLPWLGDKLRKQVELSLTLSKDVISRLKELPA